MIFITTNINDKGNITTALVITLMRIITQYRFPDDGL